LHTNGVVLEGLAHCGPRAPVLYWIGWEHQPQPLTPAHSRQPMRLAHGSDCAEAADRTKAAMRRSIAMDLAAMWRAIETQRVCVGMPLFFIQQEKKNGKENEAFFFLFLILSAKEKDDNRNAAVSVKKKSRLIRCPLLLLPETSNERV
jgi:hypothetical protein